jgi:glutamate dehydrogenase/leucine dehydrogenase
LPGDSGDVNTLSAGASPSAASVRPDVGVADSPLSEQRSCDLAAPAAISHQIDELSIDDFLVALQNNDTAYMAAMRRQFSAKAHRKILNWIVIAGAANNPANSSSTRLFTAPKPGSAVPWDLRHWNL